ncbi:MAG TPA: imidazole glycerol phosphate synthase subunit HisH [bacterium]|nr:imidazole glycerol phosphate synthase subunit HisH [bacterium]
MIGIVMHGSGNLFSLCKAVEKLGGRPLLVERPRDLERVKRLILPGVGAAGSAARTLRRLGLWEPIHKTASKGVPVLGICLGMQLLFTHCEEDETSGLDWFSGVCVRFQPPLRVPHMGWSPVKQVRDHVLWRGVPDGTCFYFAHSYAVPAFSQEDILGSAVHGRPFVAAAVRGRTVGVQFHPEKSQHYGLRVLENFMTW